MSQFEDALPHAKDFLGSDATQLFLNQVLLAMVIKQGGQVTLPVSDVDATGGYIMEMSMDPHQRTFTLIAKQKQ